MSLRAELGLNPRTVLALARKEFLDSVRNKWIIAVTAVFIILTLVASYLGAAQTGGGLGFRGLAATVIFMISIEAILLPILGLMVSYASLAGEKEQGSLQLLSAHPITRPETVLGKFLGLGGVLAVAIVTGLMVSALVIIAAVGTEGFGSFLQFVVISCAFGLVFVSVGILLSSMASRRSVALGGAVLLWFVFAFIYDLIVLGVFLATGGVLGLQPGTSTTYPAWYWALEMVNPVDSFSLLAAIVFAIRGAFGVGFGVLPEFVNGVTLSLVFVAWIVVPLLFAIARIRDADL